MSRQSRDSPRFPPEPYNLYAFYSASDGPWIPNAAIPPAATLNQSSRLPFSSGERSFQGYRSAGLPSESGTAPEDSGYGGTRSTYSLVESAASIPENDRCTDTGYLETQTAEQLIGDLNINSAIPVYQPPMPYTHSPSVKHPCDQCPAILNTRSELKYVSCQHRELDYFDPLRYLPVADPYPGSIAIGITSHTSATTNLVPKLYRDSAHPTTCPGTREQCTASIARIVPFISVVTTLAHAKRRSRGQEPITSGVICYALMVYTSKQTMISGSTVISMW
jgi:hypothetical protein